MIFHYTLQDVARQIKASDVLRAVPMLVYRDLLAQDPVELESVVWFTINPILDGTVVIKAAAQGLDLSRPRSLWRFGVDDAVAPLSLPEWAEQHGHSPDLFRWMVLTGKAAGSDYTCWRIAERDVPRAEWLAVEWFDNGQWRAE